MEASQPFGTFQRHFKEIMAFLNRPVFAKPKPARRPAVRPLQPVASPALAVVPVKARQVEKPASVVVARQALPAVEQPVVAAPPAKVQAPEEKPMRTLAEVRADLARLREKSRERQAQQRAQARYDVAFPATDFMEFVPSAPERRSGTEEAGESFAPTAYLDFTVLKTR
ncbi:hypothetical protein VAR608DRAFT_0629 [Variovorax sp. HW608]|uniref:hypothetical protein n=1 Tax=Variovorax sp. HW608 TaxID=1034889 RepID=UPI00081FC2E4|nr:hypothetical protein [Variovorax sp. HW608]SCK11816.1 hypothetical protein VAR608DRAFT_0629 [Variovorax sp. HW608]